MSMREEVKVRCSAAEKAAWQEYAAEDERPLSEVVRDVMNAQVETRRLWKEQNAQLDGTALIDNAIALIDADESQFRTLLASLVEADDIVDIAEEGHRRTDVCEHGRPAFIFCGTCDA